MDADGWVPAAEIAQFNRVRALLAGGGKGADPALAVVAALEGSAVVEAVDAPTPRLRPREGGARWALVGEEGGQ